MSKLNGNEKRIAEKIKKECMDELTKTIAQLRRTDLVIHTLANGIECGEIMLSISELSLLNTINVFSGLLEQEIIKVTQMQCKKNILGELDDEEEARF